MSAAPNLRTNEEIDRFLQENLTAPTLKANNVSLEDGRFIFLPAGAGETPPAGTPAASARARASGARARTVGPSVARARARAGARARARASGEEDAAPHDDGAGTSSDSTVHASPQASETTQEGPVTEDATRAAGAAEAGAGAAAVARREGEGDPCKDQDVTMQDL